MIAITESSLSPAILISNVGSEIFWIQFKT